MYVVALAVLLPATVMYCVVMLCWLLTLARPESSAVMALRPWRMEPPGRLKLAVTVGVKTRSNWAYWPESTRMAKRLITWVMATMSEVNSEAGEARTPR